ncbi:Fe2+-dependent dioxygenase [Caldimonas sp.]|uniref:Fe2+-dependent dioxygenase n=1 Tax=Caldimonas sp. TaxID=2838790 RepID=UPI003919BA18
MTDFLVLDEVLTREELAWIRATLAQCDWQAGLSAGAQALAAKNNLQLPEEDPALPELRRVVMRALNRHPLLVSAALPNKIIPPNFNRYVGERNAYRWHVDNTLRELPDGSWLRTDVSATLFLSDPEDYEGGELTIEASQGWRTLKGAAGSLVIYPSGTVHQVQPVTGGERLACYFFIQSLVRDAHLRDLLFKMDLALMRLRERLGPADGEVVRLTATYHNLLRLWSEC